MRYLTKRFIGEYRSKTDLLYRQTISLDNNLLDVEIVDVSTESDEFPIEQVQWADSCLIVYSITDSDSFKYAADTLVNMKNSLQNNPPAYLIGNKCDLDHMRKVIII